MKKDLIKLSEYLKSRKFSKQARMVAAFVRSSQEKNFQSLQNYFPNLKVLKVPISETKSVDLLSNKLGIIIFKFLANAFLIADHSNGVISAKEIDNFVETSFKFDSRFKEHKTRVSKPIPPDYMRALIQTAIPLMKFEFNNNNKYDIEEVYDIAEILIEAYIDAYHHDYLEMEQQENDFLGQDPGYAGEIIQPQISDEKLKELNNYHDAYYNNMKLVDEADRKWKEQDPEGFQHEFEKKKKQERRRVPSSWHKAIFNE